MNPPGLIIAETTFQPQATGHLCIKAVIEHLEDTTPDNNEGQENLHVGYSSSPTDVCFSIWNLTNEPAPVYLEVRQLIDPSKDRKEQRLWASSIRHPDNQVLQPGERAEACITVDPDLADAKEGTQAEFAVTAFIGKKMIGGINLVMAKKTSDILPWPEQVCKALALLNAVLLAALIVALGAMNNMAGLEVAVLLVIAATIWKTRCHPKMCRIIRTFLAGAGLGAFVLIILALLGTSSSQLIAVLAAAVVLIIILAIIGFIRKCL
jgi:hypothetical protein